jgi:hypothetical protein
VLAFALKKSSNRLCWQSSSRKSMLQRFASESGIDSRKIMQIAAQQFKLLLDCCSTFVSLSARDSGELDQQLFFISSLGK